MITASGCKTTEPHYCVPVIVERDRYVPAPETLTTPVEIVELSESFDVYELGAAYNAQKVRAMQCNGQLAEIATIK